MKNKIKKGGNDKMYMTTVELDSFFEENAITFTTKQMNAVKEYLRQGYDINEELRCAKNNNIVNNTVLTIDESFVEFTITKSFCLFRGIPSPLRYMIEKQICDKGYCSTTRSFQMGQHFMTYDDSHETCCVFHIHFQKNNKIRMLPVKYDKSNAHEHEQEILFPRNTEFRVITNNRLLEQIAKEMDYILLENPTYQDRFALQEGVMNNFGFKVFQRDNVLIIPIQVVQKDNCPTQNTITNTKTQSK